MAEIPDFRQLIREAQNGSPHAVNELIRSVQGYLLLVANQELAPGLRTKVAASDVVQQTLVQAEQNLGQFRGESRETLLHWMRTILRNEICAAHRGYQAGKRDKSREAPVDSESVQRPELADRHPTPQTKAVIQEEAAALQRALRRLPDDYRTVIALRNWERLSFHSIAQKMERSPDAAKKLWARAIRQLRLELGRESAPDQC